MSKEGGEEEKIPVQLPHPFFFFGMILHETRFMQLHYPCISSSLLTPEPFVHFQTFRRGTEVSKIIKF